MIITPEDFTERPYKIANQQESKDLQAFIDRKEEEILIELLGYELFKEFSEALDASGELLDKWENLKDGAEYESGDKTYKYKGIIDLIRPAIMSELINPNNYKLTNVGYVENAPKESTVLDPEPFIISLWNEYCNKAGGCVSLKNTFYGFMNTNKADYPTWSFCQPKHKNRYGL